ncbi:MAG: ArsR family transcriptional regulator [Myxococcota bacterium]
MSDDRIARLEARVAALEALLKPSSADVDIALLTRLRQVPGDERVNGSVQLSGSVNISGRRAVWQTIHPAASLVGIDADLASQVLGALGHPLRIQIVLALLQGPRKAQDIEARLSVGSTGKLYHHLKELVTAGIVVQPRRSEYAVATAAVIPLLGALAMVADLRAGSSSLEG